VQIVQRFVLAKLRHRRFFSLAELNAAIRDCVAAINAKVMRRVGKSRNVYCGPVLRHPTELMLPAVDLGGRVWLGGKPCKGGPAAPAFGG
jgi:hypothetical protein